jgi:hypothetical protein
VPQAFHFNLPGISKRAAIDEGTDIRQQGFFIGAGNLVLELDIGIKVILQRSFTSARSQSQSDQVPRSSLLQPRIGSTAYSRWVAFLSASPSLLVETESRSPLQETNIFGSHHTPLVYSISEYRLGNKVFLHQSLGSSSSKKRALNTRQINQGTKS